MYTGVLIGNHYVLKQAELHLLELQKKLLETSGQTYFSWQSYVYGIYKDRAKFEKTLSSLAHYGIGVFQFAVPLLFALATLILVPFFLPLNSLFWGFYLFAAFLVMLASISAIYLAVLGNRIRKQHVDQFTIYERMASSSDDATI